jgi:general stress protein 26
MDELNLKRVLDELKTVGVGSVGLRTPEAKELVRVLHSDEHIGGVIYGRYASGLAWLIATDSRVIFMDKKPLHTTMDELTYDVVSGVKSMHAGLVASVTLHTRVNDYAFRYVNKRCAQIFVKFIESRRLESGKFNQATYRYTQEEKRLPVFQNANQDAINFLRSHDLAVLSTVDRTGNVHGAIIYYLIDKDNYIYILTKTETGKGRNVYAHSQVALTVHEPGSMQTAQLSGVAEVETDQQVKDSVFKEITKPRDYKGKTHSPPVKKLHEGAFMIIRITPTEISYHDYAKID